MRPDIIPGVNTDPAPVLMTLVTWADIRDGDRVWFMGNIMTVLYGPYLCNNAYDRANTDWVRFHVRDEEGREFGPPVRLDDRVAVVEGCYGGCADEHSAR